MTKKIRLFILSIITILWVWITFADVVEPNQHYVDKCVKLQNVEIDNYRVIVDVETVMDDWEVYEPNTDKCLRQHYHVWKTKQYLLDKSIDISEITKENIQNKAIQIWELKVNWHYVDDINPLKNETITYKIVKNWDNYKLEIAESEQGIAIPEARITKFFIARILTILIETLVLFAIAKLFRKKDQISNKRVALIWILASTITLPLLRFVLPIFINDETIYIIIWETLVTLIEIFIIKYWLKVSRWKAILASIACNLCSYLFGLFVL